MLTSNVDRHLVLYLYCEYIPYGVDLITQLRNWDTELLCIIHYTVHDVDDDDDKVHEINKINTNLCVVVCIYYSSDSQEFI